MLLVLRSRIHKSVLPRFCMKDEKGLRQRSTQNNKNDSSPATSVPTTATTITTTTTTTTEQQPMVRRGPVLAYSRGGNAAASRQTLSNYKNKILMALGATILYTVFLYRSGKLSWNAFFIDLLACLFVCVLDELINPKSHCICHCCRKQEEHAPSLARPKWLPIAS